MSPCESQGLPEACQAHLYESHASFDQPPGQQHLPALDARSVEVEDMLWLIAQVESRGSLGLHSISQLEGLNPSVEKWICRPAPPVFFVEGG